MRQHTVYIFLSSFLIGIAVATIGTVTLATITWLCLIAFGVTVVSYRKHTPSLVVISFAILFCALGMLRFEIASWQFGHSLLAESVGREVQLKGEVVQEPDVREGTTQLYVAVNDEVLLVGTDSHTTIAYGDKVTVEGVLKKPESFTTDLGRTFNYPAYLLVRGVEYQVSFADVRVESSGHGNLLLELLYSIKYALVTSIESVIPEPYAGLGEGLLLGIKQGLGEDLESAFRTSGIIHIVVLSGYNVMLVVTFILFLLSFFFPKRIRIIGGLLAIIAFALLVGLSATVVRASVMAGLLLVAEYLGRRYDLPRALLFAATLMVFLNPYLLVYDVGFQLSCMATLGLILVAPTFESFISDGFSKLRIKDFLVSTIATQIAVLPLLMYHIGEVSLVAVVVNVLVLPVVPLAMLLTFLSGVMAMVFVPVAMLVGFLAYSVLRYITETAYFFSQLPAASVVVPEISSGVVAGLYVIMGVGVYFFRNKVTRDTLTSNWIIEEEKEIAPNEQNPSDASAKIPVFFR